MLKIKKTKSSKVISVHLNQQFIIVLVLKEKIQAFTCFFFGEIKFQAVSYVKLHVCHTKYGVNGANVVTFQPSGLRSFWPLTLQRTNLRKKPTS